jgi:hypothetical protein
LLILFEAGGMRAACMPALWLSTKITEAVGTDEQRFTDISSQGVTPDGTDFRLER